MRTLTRTAALVSVALCAVASAGAAITASPPVVTVYPSQTSAPVMLTLTYAGAETGGSDTVQVLRLPAGATTVPDPVTYAFLPVSTSTSTTFQIAVPASVAPGTYTLTLLDSHTTPTKATAGSGTMTLVVATPSLTATAIPNPATLTPGEPRSR